MWIWGDGSFGWGLGGRVRAESGSDSIRSP